MSDRTCVSCGHNEICCMNDSDTWPDLCGVGLPHWIPRAAPDPECPICGLRGGHHSAGCSEIGGDAAECETCGGSKVIPYTDADATRGPRPCPDCAPAERQLHYTDGSPSREVGEPDPLTEDTRSETEREGEKPREPGSWCENYEPETCAEVVSEDGMCKYSFLCYQGRKDGERIARRTDPAKPSEPDAVWCVPAIPIDPDADRRVDELTARHTGEAQSEADKFATRANLDAEVERTSELWVQHERDLNEQSDRIDELRGRLDTLTVPEGGDMVTRAEFGEQAERLTALEDRLREVARIVERVATGAASVDGFEDELNSMATAARALDEPRTGREGD